MSEAALQVRSIQLPEIGLGEHYAGIILGADGAPSHHLILMPGDDGALNWADAKASALSIGGELPTRREQSLLFANLREQFKADWYWSSEPNGSGWAWCQDFTSGTQYGLLQYDTLRARAVRRLVI